VNYANPSRIPERGGPEHDESRARDRAHNPSRMSAFKHAAGGDAMLTERNITWRWAGETFRVDFERDGAGPILLLLPALSSISTRRDSQRDATPS
jgi:hypothetical protein